MVIDPEMRSCGACALACKTENNTQDRADGQTFNWADYIQKEEGKFPNAKASTMPVLCNHCTDAPCVQACPVTPKAMFQTPDSITGIMMNEASAAGTARGVSLQRHGRDKSKAAYSVLSFNAHGGSDASFLPDSERAHSPAAPLRALRCPKRLETLFAPHTLQAPGI